MLRYFKRGAFTIIEFLIVVAIIIFLAKILVPRYAQYYAQARQTEVAINLTSLYAAQQRHHLLHGRYTPNLGTLEWQPKGYTSNQETTQNYYTYGGNGGSEGAQHFTGSSHTSPHHLPETIATGDKLRVSAGLHLNGKTELWQIDENGSLEKANWPTSTK